MASSRVRENRLAAGPVVMIRRVIRFRRPADSQMARQSAEAGLSTARPVRSTEMGDERSQHSGEALVQPRDANLFFARDVGFLQRRRELASRLQRRAACDTEVVGEMAISELTESLADVTRNLPG